MSAEGPARVRELVCVGTAAYPGCEDTFEEPVRPGPPPTRCPDCRKIRKQFSDEARRRERRAWKLAESPAAVRCRACGEAIEGRRGRRGRSREYCDECSLKRRLERNRRSAAASYRRRKAAR